jgi:cytochrome c5
MIGRRLDVFGVLVFFVALFMAMGPAAWQAAAQSDKQASAGTPTSRASASAPSDEALRIEGEKRFSANCGRCHQSPHKLPPRMMATAIRHMRVRALITDEDMRLILLYMTQ